jgi:hypothetical protein
MVQGRGSSGQVAASVWPGECREESRLEPDRTFRNDAHRQSENSAPDRNAAVSCLADFGFQAQSHSARQQAVAAGKTFNSLPLRPLPHDGSEWRIEGGFSKFEERRVIR